MTGRKTKIPTLPPDDTPSGWVPANMLSVIGKAPNGDRVTHFDWVVVGAGFTGLAAARRLGELHPQHSIALVDAKPIGWGTSGRNSGFIIDLPHKFDLDTQDPKRLAAVMQLNTTAIADLKAHVEAGQIACEWSRTGKLQGAVRQRGSGKMVEFMQALDSIGQPYTRLDRDDVATITGTEYYAGAVHTPECILMNPVKLTRGLARTMPPNVCVLDGCPVLETSKEKSGYVLRLRSQGVLAKILTQKLLLCTNAYTSEFGYLKQRIVPVITFASMTRPLSDADMALYKGQLDWGLTPADPGGTTLRMTQDRRLLIRNQYDYAGQYGVKDTVLDKIRKTHRATLDRRYPELAHVPFESCWGGVCALSSNHVSYFGELSENVWNSSCHNGVGVARGTISGRLLAEAASGEDSDLLAKMYAVSNIPSRNPPNPILALGVRARLKMAAWESRQEI